LAVSRSKTWISGEILSASDLNQEFNNILSGGESLGWPATVAKDLDGQELILDADADTSITADTDDQIDFRVGGTDRVRMTSTGLNVVSGTLQENGVGIIGNINRQAGMWLFKAQTGRAMAMDNAGNMPLAPQVFS